MKFEFWGLIDPPNSPVYSWIDDQDDSREPVPVLLPTRRAARKYIANVVMKPKIVKVVVSYEEEPCPKT